MAIFTALVRNKMGLEYTISQDNTTPFSTITCDSLGGRFITVRASVGDLNRGWYAWFNGKLAQDAFPFLSASEREFLITGITPEEWDKLFSEDK